MELNCRPPRFYGGTPHELPSRRVPLGRSQGNRLPTQEIPMNCPFAQGQVIEGRIEHHSMQNGKSTQWVALVVKKVQGAKMIVTPESSAAGLPSEMTLQYKPDWFRKKT